MSIFDSAPFRARLGLEQITETSSPAARVRSMPKKLPARMGPIWGSVTITTEHATSPSLKCNNCGRNFCGGETRIKEHITGTGVIGACDCETDAFLDLKQKMLEEAEDKADSKRQKVAECEVDAASAMSDVKPFVKSEKGGAPKMYQQGITASINSAKAADVDAAVAEFFYGCNIPPNIVDHSLFKALAAKLRAAPASYKLPDRHRVAGDLLDSTTARLKEEEAPIREVILKDCGTVVSDGWDDVARNHLINFLCGTSKGMFFDGTVMLSSTDSEDAKRVAELIISENREGWPDARHSGCHRHLLGDEGGMEDH